MVNLHITDGEEYSKAVFDIQRILHEHNFTIVEALGIISIVEFELNEQRYGNDD